MTLPLLFTGAFVTALSGALMPGPVLSATIHQASRHGPLAGVMIALGHCIPEIALVSALFFGAMTFIEKNDTFLAVIGLVGGTVLMLLAFSMARYRPKSVGAEEEVRRGGRWIEPLAAGAITTISTPPFYWWWAAVGLPLMADAREHAVIGFGVFYVGHMLADVAWFGFVGAAIARGRTIAGGAAVQWLVRACALFMAGLGAWFVASGLRSLGAL